MVSFEAVHFERDIILTCVRWYVAYPLSYRRLEELMREHGVSVDHATIHRWVLKYRPQLEAVLHRRKRLVQLIWRMDETSIRVKGRWSSLYRAVDKTGQTIDFLPTEHRNTGAAISIRQVEYLNRVVEQDHRSVKRVTRPMLGFKSFDAAQYTLAGIELMHMARKGQREEGTAQGLTATEQFYALAA